MFLWCAEIGVESLCAAVTNGPVYYRPLEVATRYLRVLCYSNTRNIAPRTMYRGPRTCAYLDAAVAAAAAGREEGDKWARLIQRGSPSGPSNSATMQRRLDACPCT